MKQSKINQDKKLEILKSKICDFDLAVPGRLRTIYSKCGKDYCACQTDKKARHGPYILWDRKVNGKLSSKMVSKKMALQIKKWIANRKELEKLVQELFSFSQSIASDLVEQERNSEGKKM
jgi:hypothetical protein